MTHLKGKRSTKKILGWYLVVIALYQIVHALRIAFPTFRPSPFLNPRLGLEWVIGNALSLGDRGVIVMLVVAGLILLALGIGILSGHQVWVRFYIIVEIVLSLPSIHLMGSLLISGGGHVVSRDDLPLMLFVFTLATIIPLVLAIRSLNQRKTVDAQSPS